MQTRRVEFRALVWLLVPLMEAQVFEMGPRFVDAMMAVLKRRKQEMVTR